MEKHSQNDFRILRRKLPPEDFAIYDSDFDMPPSDPIDKETWASIISLPDDVSIRTSDHHGSVLKKLWDLLGEWIDLVGVLQDAVQNSNTSPIACVACDITDELQASVYNALVGYYRLAFSSLRNVLEQMTVGLQLNLAGDQNVFQAWIRGNCEIKFGTAADQVLSHEPVANLEHNLFERVGDDLFRQSTPTQVGGFARRLFSELSNFTHGNPKFSGASIWQSNGPIYVPQAFAKWTKTFAKTYALAVLETKLSQPDIGASRFRSSLTVRDLYEKSVDMLAAEDDGFTVLKAAQDILW